MNWFDRYGGYYVYWLCGDAGVLYVGYTDNPGRRIKQHRARKPWFNQVTTVDICRFATKEEALKEEAMSIMFGENLYNKQLHRRFAREAFADAYDGIRYEELERYDNVPVSRFH